MPRVAVNMPKMSMTMETGTLVEWAVEVGQEVKDGDVLCVVSTDKVDMDMEATANGTVAELVAHPGDVMPVGQPIAYLESATDDLLGDLFGAPEAGQSDTGQSGDVEARAEQENTADTETVEQGDFESDSADKPTPSQDQVVAEASVPDEPGHCPCDDDRAVPPRIRAVPLARSLAKALNVDLAALAEHRQGQVVRARDVREAAECGSEARAEQSMPAAQPSPAQQAAAAPISPPVPSRAASGGDRRSRVRQATAQVMMQSAQIPQFTAYRTLNLTATARARKAGLKGVTWTTIMVRAYALVLEQFPGLNASWGESGVVENDRVVVSLAVDTPDGLLAPALTSPQRTSTKALDADIRDIAQRLKDGDQAPDLFARGTGTVSNLGGMGVDRFNALLTPPQATALSLGAVTTKVGVDEDGEQCAYLGCTVGLTVDHRVADGADAARALAALQEFLADPITLLA